MTKQLCELIDLRALPNIYRTNSSAALARGSLPQSWLESLEKATIPAHEATHFRCWATGAEVCRAMRCATLSVFHRSTSKITHSTCKIVEHARARTTNFTCVLCQVAKENKLILLSSTLTENSIQHPVCAKSPVHAKCNVILSSLFVTSTINAQEQLWEKASVTITIYTDISTAHNKQKLKSSEIVKFPANESEN